MPPSTGLSGILLSVRTQYAVTVRDLTGAQSSDPLQVVEHHSFTVTVRDLTGAQFSGPLEAVEDHCYAVTS